MGREVPFPGNFPETDILKFFPKTHTLFWSVRPADSAIRRFSFMTLQRSGTPLHY
jgi:hypothetical protein